MSYFRLRSPCLDRKTTYLEGGFPWAVPYLKCSICNRNKLTEGVAYPAVDLSKRKDRDEYSSSKRTIARSAQVIKEMVERLSPSALPGLSLPPGSNLGPFAGCVDEPSKRLFDFAWAYSFPFVTGEVLSVLRDAGLSELIAIPSEIIFKKHQLPGRNYFQLQVRGEVSLADPLGAPFGISTRHSKCQSCGSDNGHLPKQLRILKDSIPSGVSLMHCREYPVCKIVSEEFAQTVRTAGFNGQLLEPIQLV